MGSLFDGIGGFILAGNQVGIDTLWSSEIDPCCEAVTKHHFPEVKQLGDITKIKGAEVPPVDIICGGSPCFPEGTLVLTRTGYKPIETIKENDKVLTHTGEWRRVLKIGSKISNTIVLKGQGHYGIECTPEHPFYAANRYWTYRASESRSPNSRSGVRKLSAPTWTEAKDMVGKMWATPTKIKEVPIPHIEKKSVFCNDPPEMNEAFWYVVGRWLGDGWTRNSQRKDRREGCTHGNVIICCGNYRKYGLKDKLDAAIPGWYQCEDDGSSSKFRIVHTGFADWLDMYFGKYAHGKRIPAFCFSMKESLKQALLDGICSSDGYAYKPNTYKITTVGKELAIGIRLLAEGLGYSTSLWKFEMPESCIIDGRSCSQRAQYCVSLTSKRRTNGMRTDNHSWYSVKEIVNCQESTRVYNLEVETDNSYVVENLVVHNCQDLSVAGKRAGLAGERSGLYMEQIRIIREMRAATNNTYPRYMVWENVPGALSSNKGEDFRAVLEEAARCADKTVSIPESKKWSNAGCIVGNGWSIAWRILDAQFWGVPQRRRRIFLVADFGSERAGEVLFKQEGLRGYSAEGRTEGQGTAADAERSLRGSSVDGVSTLCFDGTQITSPQNGNNPQWNAPCHPLAAQGYPPTVIVSDAEGSIGGGLSSGVKCLNPSMPQSSRIYDANGIYPALSANENGGQNRQAVLFTQNQRDEVRDLSGVAAALAAESGMHQTNYVCEPVAAFVGGQGAKARTIAYSENVSPSLKSVPSGGNTIPDIVYPTVTGTICASGAGTSRPAGQGNETELCIVQRAFRSNSFYEYEESEIGAAIRASGGNNSFGSETLVMATGQANAEIASGISTTLLAESHEQPIVTYFRKVKNRKYIIRRLTPLECERLQGYPDGWTDIKYKNKPMSDSARYRMEGNSVAIPCVVRVLGGIVAQTQDLVSA
ncbi:MAG: DNA cytosine methyltransferase [Alphaproteobacteria bacterium]|nr:DNA cytosine methyltransferase [Alphaproteobacteria bacterium]